MIPNNEFTEHCTGDMPSMDSAHHYMMSPERSDFPDAAQRQQKYWIKHQRDEIKFMEESMAEMQVTIDRLKASLRKDARMSRYYCRKCHAVISKCTCRWWSRIWANIKQAMED